MANRFLKTLEAQDLSLQDRSRLLIRILMAVIIAMIALVGLVLVQVFHRPPPTFSAINPSGQNMSLQSYDSPNLMADTLITWASKAAVAAYTFDFSDYENENALARPYFTASGWSSYQAGIAKVLQRVVKGKLFVNGVVSGAPVITNQGDLPGHGYNWRIQLPFLVTFQSAEQTRVEHFYVSMMIVRVPTTINPQGIGIDQFQMASG